MPVLHSRVPFDLIAHYVARNAFGFFPKISTTVENTVEKRPARLSSLKFPPVFADFTRAKAPAGPKNGS